MVVAWIVACETCAPEQHRPPGAWTVDEVAGTVDEAAGTWASEQHQPPEVWTVARRRSLVALASGKRRTLEALTVARGFVVCEVVEVSVADTNGVICATEEDLMTSPCEAKEAGLELPPVAQLDERGEVEVSIVVKLELSLAHLPGDSGSLDVRKSRSW